MPTQTKKVLYWINNIFFLSALMFFNVLYISIILGTINPAFDIFFDINDSIIPYMLLSYAVPTITTVLSVCFFRKIISKATIILQIISSLLVLFPFVYETANSYILTVLHLLAFIITLIFFIKDSKRFVD